MLSIRAIKAANPNHIQNEVSIVGGYLIIRPDNRAIDNDSETATAVEVSKRRRFRQSTTQKSQRQEAGIWPLGWHDPSLRQPFARSAASYGPIEGGVARICCPA